MEYEFDGDETDYGTEQPRADFAPNSYEQLKLVRERRKLARSEQHKYESLRACLELKKELVEAKVKLAALELAKAGAERDRAHEFRMARKDRRRELRLRKKVAEARLQTSIQMQALVKDLNDAAAEAQSEREKRMLLEHAELLDPQTAEFLACPKCNKRMEYDRHGRVCIYCPYRPEDE